MQLIATHFTRLARKVLPILLAAALLPGTASAARILRYSDHEPLGGMRTRFIKDVFFTAIEKESDGRLKIEDHWDAELSSGYDALDTVGKGEVADMATVVPEYMAKELPLHQIFKSFPTGPAGANQVSLFRHVYGDIPEFSAEMNKNNAVPLLLCTGYPVAFFGITPFLSLEEIKGQAWRSASFWHLDFLRNAGAVPVNTPWGEEVVKALQARTLNGLMVNVDSGYMLKVHHIAPYISVSRNLWLGHLYMLSMNRTTWESLTSEDKLAVQRAAETAYKALGPEMERSYDAMLEDLKRSGALVRQLDRKELKAWEAATQYQNVQATWVKEQAGKGLKEAGAVMEKVKVIINEADCPIRGDMSYRRSRLTEGVFPWSSNNPHLTQ